MIDAERLAELKTAIRGGESPKDPLAEMSQSELRRLRSEIDRLLPDKQTLGEMASMYFASTLLKRERFAFAQS